MTYVTLLAGGIPRASVSGDNWSVALGENIVRFRIGDGAFAAVGLANTPVPELRL
jgi:hypothetical protein